jgi:glutaredoxin-related protein
MKDNDKLVALIRLRDIIYSGVRPTMRECGFSGEIIQELVKEQLIQSRYKNIGDDSDRNVIEEILPAGHSFISQHHALRDQHNLTPVLA